MMAPGGGSNSSKYSSGQWIPDTRERDIALFRELETQNVSVRVLAMGLSLLEKSWAAAGAEEDWLAIEDELLSEVGGLDAEYQRLNKQMSSFDAKKVRWKSRLFVG